YAGRGARAAREAGGSLPPGIAEPAPGTQRTGPIWAVLGGRGDPGRVVSGHRASGQERFIPLRTSSSGTTPCSRGSSWSADLDKCMDCASCPARPHSDFCLGCAASPPASFPLLWPILGGALSLALVLGLLSGFLVWRRCRRREKFTTPIEETGGEGCPGVALIQ
uniref:TNF receptor superfamily member 12A n=1 Tax=Felis catus TaxID=9685 RepID=A0ABI7WWM4_FELCA